MFYLFLGKKINSDISIMGSERCDWKPFEIIGPASPCKGGDKHGLVGLSAKPVMQFADDDSSDLVVDFYFRVIAQVDND